VKQHLAALRQLFDWLVQGQIVRSNPLAHVRGPRHSALQGKTPVLMAPEARAMIRSIPTDTLIGLRDRALIGVMTYSFARVSAALQMNVKDVFPKHHRLWLRLHEKGGKYHEMPCHHTLEQYLRDYLDAAGLAGEPGSPLFPSIDRVTKTLSGTRLHRMEALAMVKRRARNAGIETPGICNHTFRGSGITSYLGHPDARLEVAQYMAGHADPKTTRIYDRRQEIVTLDEVERIGI
jgi:site-specific recombinase XerD